MSKPSIIDTRHRLKAVAKTHGLSFEQSQSQNRWVSLILPQLEGRLWVRTQSDHWLVRASGAVLRRLKPHMVQRYGEPVVGRVANVLGWRVYTWWEVEEIVDRLAEL